MGGFQAIADRAEIEALRGEFTDAVMMRDHGRVASRLRGQVPRHHAAGGLGAPRGRERPLTRRPDQGPSGRAASAGTGAG